MKKLNKDSKLEINKKYFLKAEKHIDKSIIEGALIQVVELYNSGVCICKSIDRDFDFVIYNTSKVEEVFLKNIYSIETEVKYYELEETDENILEIIG